MGVELVIGAVAAAASVISGVMQMNLAKKAAGQRKEANKVQNAQQKNDSMDQRRKAIREARVRRAMIMQQSANAGLGGGSGEAGAVGAVNTNLGSNIGQASGQTLAIEGINKRNQAAADYDFKAQQWGAFGNIFATALGSFQTSQPKAPSYDFG